MEIKISIYKEGKIVVRCPPLKINKDKLPELCRMRRGEILFFVKHINVYHLYDKLMQSPLEEVEFYVFYSLTKGNLPLKYPTTFDSIIELIDRGLIEQVSILMNPVSFSNGPTLEKTMSLRTRPFKKYETGWEILKITDLEKILRLWTLQNPISV